jgi:threonine synthase
VATAIRIGNPASWEQAITARDDSGGIIDMVTDREILGAQRLLATREGIWVEPASAAGVAGLLKLHAAGRLERGLRIVVTVTGHGLKDPDIVLLDAPERVCVPVDPDAAAAALGLATAPVTGP